MNSLRNRVIAIVMLASLLTVVAIATTAYQSLREDQQALIIQQKQLETESLTQQVSQNIQQRIMVLSAARPLLTSGDQLLPASELGERIRDKGSLQRTFPDGILVFDAQDTAIAESTFVPERIGTNYADRPHFQRLHQTGEPVISAPIMGRTTNVPLLSFLIPIHHNDTLIGSLGGIIQLGDESILPERDRAADAHDGTLSFIIDARNRLYIESPTSDVDGELQALPSPGQDPLVDAALDDTENSGIIDYKGERYLLITESVEPLNWVFVRAIPYSHAMAPLRASFNQFLMISAFVTVVLLLFAWLAARSLTRPLTRATQSIHAMADQPENSETLPEKGPREIRELSNAFNRLSSERKHLDGLKNDFISSVSHELRTPLTSISGSLKMMVSGVAGQLPEKAQSLAEVALRNSNQLNALIRDLLDFNKLLAGKREFELSQCCVDKVIEEARQGNQTMASMYQVQLHSGGQSDLSMHADPQALRQVLDNLISNAIKHSPAGGEVWIEATRAQNGFNTITVSDQGEGVPDSFRERIFQRFAQAERGTTRATSGTGLGLAISRELVHGMGGEIGFYNDNGAHFWLELPSADVTGN